MRDTIKIRLGRTESKSSANSMASIHMDIGGNRSFLPTSDVMETLSLNTQFMNEREASSKYRVVIELSPVISNSLFNNVTEIVRLRDGKVECLNYTPMTVSDTYYKENMVIDNHEAVRDTQFSSEKLGFRYYCGRDIFNNHVLRNKSFKSVCKIDMSKHYTTATDPKKVFNTIDDFMRLPDGKEVISSPIAPMYGDKTISAHLYDMKDIYPFSESIDKRLEERNGWFGFSNRQTINVFDEDDKYQDIHRVINYESPGSFISMYPGKNEYSLIPQYNDFTGELEDNWNYCLTYPSSSTTQGIEFIDHGGLLIREIYEGEKRTDGTYSVEMSTFASHGLLDGDIVNVYRYDVDLKDEPEMVIQSEEISVIDDHTFSVPSRDFDDGSSVELDTVDGEQVISEENQVYFMKRVVNGIECEYYVRIFSRLPNFRFADTEITPQTLYGEGSDVIERYQGAEYEFEKHVSSMGFAQTIYGDRTCQIVFTDDIDISSLRDNLGRPLTDIYLTVVKSNDGYKEWYGKGDTGASLNNLSVPSRSHCFGKLTCGFVLDEECEFSGCSHTMSNALFLNNVYSNSVSGLSMSALSDSVSDDEITYSGTSHFYGDLCSYSPYEQIEDVLEPVMFRFTPAQRELGPDDAAYKHFSAVTYDELIVDDNRMASRYASVDEIEGVEKFKTVKRVASGESICGREEGYIYNPHFKIGLRHFSVEQSMDNGFTFRCMTIEKNDDGTVEVYTEYPNYSHVGEEVIFFNVSSYSATYAKILELKNSNRFVCDAEFGSTMPDVREMVLVRRPENIPMYAEFLTDGSCSFSWRDVVRNGDDGWSDDDEWPFANGRHYAVKKFNLFLLRQDPNAETGLQTIPPNEAFADPIGKKGTVHVNEDTYYKEKDSEC